MPLTAPFDLFESKNKRNDIRSHVGLALIMGDCDELMTQWLNSVKGVVDSDGKLVRILKEMYEQEHKTSFEKRGTWYERKAFDEMRALAMHSAGGSVWACKNYAGDIQSETAAFCHRSAGWMCSVLHSPDDKTTLGESLHPPHRRRQYQTGEASYQPAPLCIGVGPALSPGRFRRQFRTRRLRQEPPYGQDDKGHGEQRQGIRRTARQPSQLDNFTVTKFSTGGTLRSDTW